MNGYNSEALPPPIRPHLKANNEAWEQDCMRMSMRTDVIWSKMRTKLACLDIYIREIRRLHLESTLDCGFDGYRHRHVNMDLR